MGPRQRLGQDTAAHAGALRFTFPRALAMLLPASYRERITPVVCPGPRSLSRLQVPLLVVRPDAALKLNKLRTQQPSMAAGSADQASSDAPDELSVSRPERRSTWGLGKQPCHMPNLHTNCASFCRRRLQQLRRRTR